VVPSRLAKRRAPRSPGRVPGYPERLGSAAGVLHVVIDFLDQVFHAAERSLANPLLRDAAPTWPPESMKRRSMTVQQALTEPIRRLLIPRRQNVVSNS